MSSTFGFLQKGERTETVKVDGDRILEGRIPQGYEVYGELTAEDYLHYRVATMGNQLSLDQTKSGIEWLSEE